MSRLALMLCWLMLAAIAVMWRSDVGAAAPVASERAAVRRAAMVFGECCVRARPLPGMRVTGIRISKLDSHFAGASVEDQDANWPTDVLLIKQHGVWGVIGSKATGTSEVICRWPSTPAICHELFGRRPKRTLRISGQPRIYGKTRPTTLGTDSNGHTSLTKVRWRNWGDQIAVGRARYTYKTCDPDCASGGIRSYAVWVYAIGLTTRRGQTTYAYGVVRDPIGGDHTFSVLADDS